MPEPGNPQAYNRFAYVYGNPVNYADPTGHAVPIDVGGHLLVHPKTGNIIVSSIAGSGLRQLIAQASVGQSSAAQRLAEILNRTAATGQLPGVLAPVDRALGKVTRSHFESTGAVKGDAGFAPEFQDDRLYAEQWGFETPESRQTGHFLTAVDMGRTGGWAHPIVGREQRGDQGLGLVYQMAAPRWYDEVAFEIAVAADTVGAIEAREASLSFIIDPQVHGSLLNRRGNSMEDLRLSVRGWRLGNTVATGQLGTNKDLANWIALNVAETDRDGAREGCSYFGQNTQSPAHCTKRRCAGSNRWPDRERGLFGDHCHTFARS